MKRAYLIAAVSMMTVSCFGQHANVTLAASTTGFDRMSMVKSNINLPAWHEKTFWPIYETYFNNSEAISAQANAAVMELANTSDQTTAEEALAISNRVLELRFKELELRRQCFSEIGINFNGIIAMQFLQVEAVLAMMEHSSVYDGTRWRKFRFYPHLLKNHDEAQVRSAKYNTMAKAVNLSVDKTTDFYQLYAKYESECDQLLGEDYSLIGLYAGDPSDFTPGLAKRLGYDMLTVMDRELKLKQKYFNEMTTVVGPVLAAKFLAWEDYYSIQNKMYAWSEGSN